MNSNQDGLESSGDEKMLERLQEAAQAILFLDARIISPDDQLETVFLLEASEKTLPKNPSQGHVPGRKVKQKLDASTRALNRPLGGRSSMEVLLLERVAKLGEMGDVVSVRSGYARNFLLPSGKAVVATKSNLAAFEGQKIQLKASDLASKVEAFSMAEMLKGQVFTLIRSAWDGGLTDRSVSPRYLAEALTEAGLSVDAGQVHLISMISEIGPRTDYNVLVKLHPEVEVQITVTVVRSQEEQEEAEEQSLLELEFLDSRALEYLPDAPIAEEFPYVLFDPFYDEDEEDTASKEQ